MGVVCVGELRISLGMRWKNGVSRSTFFHPQVDPGLAVNRVASGPCLTWRLHFTVAELCERSGLFSLFAKFSNPDIS